MITSSKLFRKVFFYLQGVILLFFVGLLVFAAPHLENQLYKNEEKITKTFLDNVVTLIRGELSAIDTYWKSSIDERQKKHIEITELQIEIITSGYTNLFKQNKKLNKEQIPSEIGKFQLSTSGKLIIINKDDVVIYHSKTNHINQHKNTIKDAYNSPVFASLEKNKGQFIQYWTKEDKKEAYKIIYYRYIPELSWYIGLEFTPNNLFKEVEKREEQIVTKVGALLAKLSIRSNGQLMIFDENHKLKISPEKNNTPNQHICQKGLIAKLKQLDKTANNIQQIRWGGNSRAKECSKEMTGWSFYFADFDWNILLAHTTDDLYKASDELKNRLIISVTIMLIALNILALLFFRKVSTQISSLSKVAEKARAGDLTHQADVTSNDELGDLAVSINSMINRINERTQKLNQLNCDYLEAKTDAEKANTSKTRFLAVVSHDLMQPLNAAKLYLSSVFMDQDENQKEKDTISKASTAIDIAEQMIHELVDISKLDAGEIQPDLETFPLQEIFYQLESNFKVLAEKWGLDFRLVNSSCLVNSDKRFLKHILQNFISNAIRYTEKGKILIGCRKNKDTISIQVWDTGPGIPKSEQELIFQEFVKGKNQSNKGENRVGLGLAIVKKMASILDVKIELKSQLGKGTVFSVSIPFAGHIKTLQSQQNTTQANSIDELILVTKNTLENKTVICIDDDLRSLDAMEGILKKLSCNTILISSIDEIDDLEEKDIKECSLIFSDYSLQNDDTGIDAIQLLNKISGHNIPAIIITGERSEKVFNICAEHGYQTLKKPAAIEKIINCVNHLNL